MTSPRPASTEPNLADKKNGRAADLQQELEALFNRQNKSQRADMTSIPATFLQVTVAL